MDLLALQGRECRIGRVFTIGLHKRALLTSIEARIPWGSR